MVNNLDEYRAKKNDQLTPTMIADELKERSDTAKCVALVVQHVNDEYEVISNCNDIVDETGLLELAKMAVVAIEHE